ncbi:MAG: peptidylprolyl isomerase [Chitinispirillaceae bacterium]|nr:peptidylprolyl isomerase [Chitinispirillaceae bacterium]
MSLKKRSCGCCAALFLFCVLTFAGKPEKIEGVVAVIGDEMILKSELDAYTALRLSERAITPDSAGSELPQYRKIFLDELIDGKVLLVHAKNDTTVSVTNDEVERAVENHFSMILRQNNLTIDSLEMILLREQGVTLARFKEEARTAIREQLLKQKVQRQYVAPVKVSRRDVEEFFVRYHDSLPLAGESVLLSKLTITASPPASVRQAAWEKILSVKQKLSNGADFAELAALYSESPEGSSGGDLGFIEKGTLNLITFEQKAFSLSPGQTSDPFETPLGFHIINVVERENLRVHVRQIFIKISLPSEQIEKIKNILDSIRASCTETADYVSAVRHYSTDSHSKSRDGRVGWFSLLDLPGPLRAAVDTLSPGYITPVVSESNEFSIYRVDDRVKERPLTLEDNWQFIAEKAQKITEQKKLIELVSRWRRQIYISIRM